VAEEETIEGRRSDLNIMGGSSSNDKLKWHRRNQPVQEFVINNFALDRKIKEACKGLMPETQWLIKREIESDQDKELVADFILQWSDHGKGGDGGMMSPNTKRVYVASLVYLLRYVKNVRNGGRVYRSFREITRDDFFAKEDPKGYLESLKRDFSDDPDKKWVSTHNTRLARYLAFWKWLTQPELRAEEITEEERAKIEAELQEVEGFIDVEDKRKEIDKRHGDIIKDDKTLNDVAAKIEDVLQEEEENKK
jgi:hypothetical protein